MFLDHVAPVVFAAVQIAVAVALAIPAFLFRSLRAPLKLAVVAALLVFALVLAFVVAFDLTSASGTTSLAAALYVGGLGGVVWATTFFIVTYVPLALLTLLRTRRS